MSHGTEWRKQLEQGVLDAVIVIGVLLVGSLVWLGLVEAFAGEPKPTASMAVFVALGLLGVFVAWRWRFPYPGWTGALVATTRLLFGLAGFVSCPFLFLCGAPHGMQGPLVKYASIGLAADATTALLLYACVRLARWRWRPPEWHLMTRDANAGEHPTREGTRDVPG